MRRSGRLRLAVRKVGYDGSLEGSRERLRRGQTLRLAVRKFGYGGTCGEIGGGCGTRVAILYARVDGLVKVARC